LGRLDGKVAVVTGAASSRGIGFASSRRLAEEGAQVFLTDIQFAGVQARVGELVAEGLNAIALEHDVSRRESWHAVIDRISRGRPQIDVLVNNAGILLPALIRDVTAEQWRRQMDVNLEGTFIGTQLVAPLMRRGGSIVNISSVSGLIGVAGTSVYSATKGGIRLFTKCAAVEFASQHIRVNSIHPGFVETDIQFEARAEIGEANYQSILQQVPLGSSGVPRDVANAVLFLASDESSYITGAELVVDGGLTAV
jgi:NAD(P)-dependent dehydrogenase (short-subunit alcohol dehydrogenase family)